MNAWLQGNFAPTRVFVAAFLISVVQPAPDFAKAMGHEEMWKLHNNCK